MPSFGRKSARGKEISCGASVASAASASSTATVASGATGAALFATASQRPHNRPDCPTYPFQSSFPQDAAVNSRHCPHCVCYVCGVPPSQCSEWNSDGAFHCHAQSGGSHGGFWRTMREEHRKEHDLAAGMPEAELTKKMTKRSISFRSIIGRHKLSSSTSSSRDLNARRPSFPPVRVGTDSGAVPSQQQQQSQQQLQTKKQQRPQDHNLDRRSLERTQRSIVNRPDGTSAVTTTHFYSDGTQEISQEEGQEAADAATRAATAADYALPTNDGENSRDGASKPPQMMHPGAGAGSGGGGRIESGSSRKSSFRGGESSNGSASHTRQHPHRQQNAAASMPPKRIPLHRAGAAAPHAAAARPAAARPTSTSVVDGIAAGGTPIASNAHETIVGKGPGPDSAITAATPPEEIQPAPLPLPSSPTPQPTSAVGNGGLQEDASIVHDASGVPSSSYVNKGPAPALAAKTRMKVENEDVLEVDVRGDDGDGDGESPSMDDAGGADSSTASSTEARAARGPSADGGGTASSAAPLSAGRNEEGHVTISFGGSIKRASSDVAVSGTEDEQPASANVTVEASSASNASSSRQHDEGGGAGASGGLAPNPPSPPRSAEDSGEEEDSGAEEDSAGGDGRGRSSAKVEYDSDTEHVRAAQVGANEEEEDFRPIPPPLDDNHVEMNSEEEDFDAASTGRDDEGFEEEDFEPSKIRNIEPVVMEARVEQAVDGHRASRTPSNSSGGSGGDSANAEQRRLQVTPVCQQPPVAGTVKDEEEHRASRTPSTTSGGSKTGGSGLGTEPQERTSHAAKRHIVRHPTPYPDDDDVAATDAAIAANVPSAATGSPGMRAGRGKEAVATSVQRSRAQQQQKAPSGDGSFVAGAAAGAAVAGAVAAGADAGAGDLPQQQPQLAQQQQQQKQPQAQSAANDGNVQQSHRYAAFAGVLPFLLKKKHKRGPDLKMKESSGSESAKANVDDTIRRIRQNDPHLTKFSFFECRLGDAGARRVADGLKKNTHLVILDLGRNGITEKGGERVAEALKENDAVQTLWLRENHLGLAGVAAVSTALECNTALTGLSLGRNHIPREGGWHLAEALRENSTLHTLWLYGNDLGDQGVAYIAGALLINTSLKELYLGGNGIGDAGAMTLCNMLGRNSTLNKLELFRNKIGDDGAGCMAEALRSNGVLIDLNLRGNNITFVGAEKLVGALGVNTALARLDLRDNATSRDVAAALAKAAAEAETLCKVLIRTESASQRRIWSSAVAPVGGGSRARSALADPHNLHAVCARLVQNDRTLIEVDLSDEGLHDPGLSRLSDALRQNEVLRVLNVRNNGITQEGVKALASALRDANATGRSALEELNLGWNDVCDEGTTAIAGAFVGGGNRTLTRLLLNNSAVSNRGAAALANLLCGGTAASPLAELHLRHNSIRCDGAAVLSESLLDNGTLRWLFLGWNDIGPVGAERLADMLRSNASISFLDLDGNNIGPNGTSALMFALRENESIDTLWLASNDVGDAGLASISDALTANASLQMLDLEYNQLGPDGAGLLADALAQNSSLRTLWLGGNGLGDRGAEVLAEALTSDACSLTELSLCWNEVSPVGAYAISSCLSHRRSRLEVLWLGGNPLTDEGVSSIADALSTNSTLSVLSLDFTGMTDDGASALFLSLEENGTLMELNLDGNKISDKGILGILEHETRANRLAAVDHRDFAKLGYIRKSNEHKEEV